MGDKKKSKASKVQDAPPPVVFAVDVSDTTLATTVPRALALLRGAGTNLTIRAALQRRGFTKEVRQHGWSLIEKASGHDVDAPASDFDRIVAGAIKTLSDDDDAVLKITEASLRVVFPAQCKYLLAGLIPSEGPEAVLNMATFTTRMKDLETSPDRKDTRKDDLAAVALVEKRGIDPTERARLEELVATANSAEDIDPSVATTAAQEAEKQRQALAELRTWYEEWAGIAHAVIKRRDHLILLGLAKRKKAKKAKPSDVKPV